MHRLTPIVLSATALLIVSLPAIVSATPPIGQKSNGWSKTEERGLTVYAACWHKLGNECGRNIVDDGLAPNGAAPSDARVQEWTATMERWLHPPKPAPTQVAAPVGSSSVAPAPATTSVPTTSGLPPESIKQCESGGDYGAVNSSSGAYGAWQILPSTSAAYGCDMSSPAGQDACAAKIYGDVGKLGLGLRRVKRLALAVVLATLAVVGTASATETHVHHPHKHLTIAKHFHPTGKPSVNMAGRIMGWEQRRFGGPSLKRRAWCESGWRWYTGNALYHGILALGDVAWNMLWVHPVTGRKVPRSVELTKHRRRWAPVYRVTVWNSGRRTRKHIGSVHQRVKVKLHGKLPKHPDQFHAWAAIRAVQLYVAKFGGGGPISWSCGL